LRTDLRALGETESQIDSLPLCDQLPPMLNIEDGIGCLYVLEGSTLGGQLIARELSRKFRIDQHSGAAFFQSYGENVGSMWIQFSTCVRGYIRISRQQEAAVLSAADTFTRICEFDQKG
jgi:heme oxygenase